MRKGWWILVLGGAAAASGWGALAQGQGFFAAGPAVSVTAAQVAHGQTVYDNNCAGCHGGHLDDGEFGPQLKGSGFKVNWGGQSADALFSFIATKMPPSGAGTLSQSDYADAEAYILSANGVAAGAAEFHPSLQQVEAEAQPARQVGAERGARHDAVYDAVMATRQALLAAMTPVTDAMLRHPVDGDWLVWRRTYANLSFSPLKQITKTNIRELGVAWSVNLAPSANEITPLVHDGIMFIESGTIIEAFNAVTGEQLWQYVRPMDNMRIRDFHQKTMALYGDALYAGTADGHVLALEARTGKLVWDTVIVPYPQNVYDSHVSNAGFHVDGGPIVAKGKLVLGVSLGTAQGGGAYIVGLDPKTGAISWRFDTVAKSGQPGGDSWNGHPDDQRFGAGVWQPGSYDPDLGLVYFGTGNTYDTDTLLYPPARPGVSNDGLYTDTTLALDPATGKLAWYFQHMNRDVWDLDWVFEQSLITLPVKGKMTGLVVTGGKLAIFDAVDRATGKYEFSRDLGHQTLVSSIDPVTGHKNINPAAEPTLTPVSRFCSAQRNWPTTAYIPDTHILYVNIGGSSCSEVSWPERDAAEIAKGGVDYKSARGQTPQTDNNMGHIQAIDLLTGKTVWMHSQRAATASSLLATAGGLLFSGDADRQFSAYDATTGERLWQTQINDIPSTSPITYAVKGQQYVALVAGGGGPTSSGNGGNSEIYGPPPSTTLWVFKLRR